MVERHALPSFFRILVMLTELALQISTATFFVSKNILYFHSEYKSMCFKITHLNTSITRQTFIPYCGQYVVVDDHPFSMYAQFPDFFPPCTHAYASAHTPLCTYAKDRQSVPVNVDPPSYLVGLPI
jgi:hypothetical protein